jgi:hypothetical protein
MTCYANFKDTTRARELLCGRPNARNFDQHFRSMVARVRMKQSSGDNHAFAQPAVDSLPVLRFRYY